MKHPFINKQEIGTLVHACMVVGASRATKYISPKLVATCKVRCASKNHVEYILTVGRPNYLQRKFIKICRKSGEPFPVSKIQMEGIK